MRKNEIDSLEKEVKNYFDFANVFVGVLFITLFVGAFSTNSPQATAILLAPIAIVAVFSIKKYYPKSITELEILAENEKNKDKQNEILKRIKKLKKTYLGIKPVFLSNLIYLYGAILYSSLIVTPNLIPKIVAWINTLNIGIK